MPTLPTWGGVRIKQKIATGRAATNAAESSEMRAKLRRAVYGSTRDAVERDTDRTAKIDAIVSRFENLPAQQQSIYVKNLNDAFGKTGEATIKPEKFKEGLPTLNDIQLNIAFQEMDAL
jgi:hypothetical protein